MVNISKSFFGVSVLENVNFDLSKGEIHSLIGENGAGKTTLMKLLTAEENLDSGQIFINGKLINLQNPKDSMKQGIAFVHQELSIFDNLSIGENIFIGRLPKNGLFIDWKMVHSQANEILKLLEVDFDSTTPAEILTVGQLQIVEIAKALSLNAEVFIMDEPTSSLSMDEYKLLFKIMRLLTKQGKSFVYISHRLNEVLDISDRITVLRDGKIVGTIDIDNANEDNLSEMIIGRKVSKYSNQKISYINTDIALEINDISTEKVNHVSLKVHKGEIVSLYGLIGSGRTELLHSILGIDKRDSGTVKINGIQYSPDYRTIIRTGVGYMPEERKTQAIFTELPVYHNITLTDFDRIRKSGLINYFLEKKIVNEYISNLNIKAKYDDVLKYLSGGNQQKVALSKWLFAQSRILFLDEPTKGIDVQARYDIYQQLRQMATNGFSILIVSSDVKEVQYISDRVIIMRNGCIVAELDRINFSEEIILSYAIKPEIQVN